MDSRYLEREMNESVIQSALASGDPAAAELAFREIDIQIQSLADPKERANLLLRKAVLYGVLKRFEDARKEPRLALEQSPNEPDIRLQVDVISGSLYDQEGKPKDAFLRLTEALSLHAEQLKLPEFRFIYEDIQQRRAFDLARMANFQDAIPLFRESLSFGLQPEEHSNLLANLGLCYAELKNYQLARDSFLQACELGLTRGLEGHVHFNLSCSRCSAESSARSQKRISALRGTRCRVRAPDSSGLPLVILGLQRIGREQRIRAVSQAGASLLSYHSQNFKRALQHSGP